MLSPSIQRTNRGALVERETSLIVLSETQRQAKLTELARDFGYAETDALLEAAVHDSVCPAICVREGCGYTTDMEPDRREGYCEACGGQTVQSALVLAGLV